MSSGNEVSRHLLANLAEYHAFLVERTGAPPLGAVGELSVIEEYAGVVRDLEIVLITSRSSVERIRGIAGQLRISVSAQSLDSRAQVEALSKLVKAKVAEARLAGVTNRFSEAKSYLARFEGQASVHGCVSRLCSA